MPGITNRVSWDVLRVNHFIIKSRAEYELKKARGDALVPTRNWDGYFEVNDRNDIEDPMPNELIERTKTEMMKISSDSGPRLDS